MHGLQHSSQQPNTLMSTSPNPNQPSTRNPTTRTLQKTQHQRLPHPKLPLPKKSQPPLSNQPPVFPQSRVPNHSSSSLRFPHPLTSQLPKTNSARFSQTPSMSSLSNARERRDVNARTNSLREPFPPRKKGTSRRAGAPRARTRERLNWDFRGF
jgi:hypothetical protein